MAIDLAVHRIRRVRETNVNEFVDLAREFRDQRGARGIRRVLLSFAVASRDRFTGW
jgi:hypothetical protein